MNNEQRAIRNTEIRALFCINTPAQVHTWRFVIEDFIRKGYPVMVMARDYGCTPELMTAFGLPFTSFKPFAWKSLRILEILTHLKYGWKLSQKLSPTVIIGFGVDAALIAATLRKPCILFTDMEPVKIQNYLNKLFSRIIVTPECFKLDFGKKHIRMQGYKELFYLHPDRFQPDPAIYSELGLARDERYAVVRFNAIDAVHDIGRKALSPEFRYRLVRELEKYCRVFISAEDDLPPDLKGNILSVKTHRIHHVLYYASLCVGDGGTMSTESALLGTPTILFGIHTDRDEYINDLKMFGNFDEMVNRYHLVQEARTVNQAIEIASRILKDENSKQLQKQMASDVIKSKIDATTFMVSIIENFHQKQLKGKMSTVKA